MSPNDTQFRLQSNGTALCLIQGRVSGQKLSCADVDHQPEEGLESKQSKPNVCRSTWIPVSKTLDPVSHFKFTEDSYSSLSLLFLTDSSFSRALVMLSPFSEGATAVVGSPSSELVKMPSSSLVAGGADPSSVLNEERANVT